MINLNVIIRPVKAVSFVSTTEPVRRQNSTILHRSIVIKWPIFIGAALINDNVGTATGLVVIVFIAVKWLIGHRIKPCVVSGIKNSAAHVTGNIINLPDFTNI